MPPRVKDDIWRKFNEANDFHALCSFVHHVCTMKYLASNERVLHNTLFVFHGRFPKRRKNNKNKVQKTVI